VSAPFVPFISEEIYGNLVRNIDSKAPESVHLCNFPVADEKFIDKDLEKNMELVLKLVVLGRACRNSANIKNRQPVARIFVKTDFELPEMFVELVKDELNVKEVVFTDDARQFTKYKFKPQLRTLGSKYGKLVPHIAKVLTEIDDNMVMDKFAKGEMVSFEVEGTTVELAEADVLIETSQKEGFVSEAERDTVVVLDTNLTPELVEEGFVREIISKIQTMRKEAGFEVQDHIKIYFANNEKVAEIIERNKAIIGEETLADEIIPGSSNGYNKEWNINGEKVNFAVEKI
jgi:isoleucyl-tRNA synthetase